MNQKQKIIIGLTSLFCGTPIIFLALRDNQQLKKNQKNNLVIKKEKKEHSFLFWTVFIILLLVILAIIFYVIYQSWPDSEDNQETETNNIHDHLKNSKSLEKKKKNFKNKKKPNKSFVLLPIPEISDEEKKRLEERSSWKCSFMLTPGAKVLNVFLCNPVNIDINKLKQKTINSILESESNELANISSDFQEQVKNCRGTLIKIFQESANYISTYLTGQFLYDVCREIQTSKKDYGILNTLVGLMKEKQDDNKNSIILHQASFNKDNVQDQEADTNEQTFIKENKPLALLKSIIQHDKITFIKYQDKKNGEQKCYLWKCFFVIYRLINQIHPCILQFFQDQIDKNNEQQEKYQRLLNDLKISKNNIEKLFTQEN